VQSGPSDGSWRLKRKKKWVELGRIVEWAERWKISHAKKNKNKKGNKSWAARVNGSKVYGLAERSKNWFSNLI
jgi:hypothetical protein